MAVHCYIWLWTRNEKECSKGAEPPARGGILDAKLLNLGKRDPCGANDLRSPDRLLLESNSILCFSEASAKYTWAQLEPAHHRHRQCCSHCSRGSSRCQCVLAVQLTVLLAGLLAPASPLTYAVTHPAFRMFLADGRGQGGLLVTEMVLGGSWSRPIFIALLCKREYCIRNHRRLYFNQSHQPLHRKPANNRSHWFFWLLFVGFFLLFT